MKRLTTIVALAFSLLFSPGLFASSHREAPITALDRTADVTDWYAFVSYDHPDRVTMILNRFSSRPMDPTIFHSTLMSFTK